jgi:hypothetical protein
MDKRVILTTQVVLMNGLGVALASDSAVTAGGKVMNTSEKVFELSSPHRVAVLSSGRAEFMGHPWEVLLSAWAGSLESPLATMEDYRESLYRFLRTILPSGAHLSGQELDYINEGYWGERNVYSSMQELLERVFVPFYEAVLSPEDLASFMTNGTWDEKFKARMTKALTKDILKQFDSEFESVKNARQSEYVAAENVSNAQARVWVDRYWSWYELEPADANFGSWPIIPTLNEKVKELQSVHLVHADYRGESNINLVGFGADDLFPSAAGVFFHGVIGGVVIKRFEGALTPSAEPRHVFFGQSDAITALTSGEDHLLTSTAVETAKKTLSDVYERLSDITDERAMMAREYLRESLETDNLADEMKRAGNERRLKPFTKAISMSPIIDLAEFAAQLVGVQAASAAMTQENPSVGGFVDVAVITHRRGFEWVRHKH